MSATLVISAVAGILDKLIPDKEKANEAKIRMLELEQQGALQELTNIKDMSIAQAEVSKAEAQHKSLFVAGARPFLIWVGGAAMAWQYILFPMAQTYLAYTGNSIVLPSVNNEVLFELVALLLGLGGFRTYEKIKLK